MTPWLQASIAAFQRILSGKRRILSDRKKNDDQSIILVGGWTNPFETYEVKLGSFPG